MATKTLYIIRHAKAELPTWDKRDFDRNIITKGIQRATEIAAHLKTLLSINENMAVYSSSANRAIQTAEIFCKTLSFPIEDIQQTREIYEAQHLDILRVINQTADHVDTLFVFGHNPGLSNLTNYICDSYIDLKTSHVAVIKLEEGIDFASLSGSTGALLQIIQEQ